MLIFLDIAPNEIFVKGVLYKDIDFSKLHKRGSGRKIATGPGFKYDYSLLKHRQEHNEIKSLEDLKKHIVSWKKELDNINN